MKHKRFKKAQRELNKIIREVNTAIEKDDLWNGRFYIDQISSLWHEYEDKSGGEIFAILVCVDKKNGQFYPYAYHFLPNFKLSRGHLFWFMNEFIVEVSDTYKNGNNPYKEKHISYINTPRVNIKYEDVRNTFNWYHGR